MSPEAISVLEETDEFDLKDQGGIGRNDISGTVGAITEVGGDVKAEFAADFHKLKRFGPAGDDLIDREFDRFTTLDGAVKNFAGQKFSFIMDAHHIFGAGAFAACSGGEDFIL